MRLRLGILFLAIWIIQIPTAQGQTISDTTRNNYALLWEISGNGLSAPSYVFGSMHVRYASVFEFPDSLLICLQACDAFANEIHLDSAMHRVLEVYAGGEELPIDSAYVAFTKEKVYVQDTNRVVENTEEKRDFRAILKDLGTGRDLRTGDAMPTMLDAHLMEIARGLGKKLYGLEQIDQHFYENEDVVPLTDRMKFSWFGNSADDLLRLYYAGDIDPIEDMIADDPREFDRLALIARNYIMVESMRRIMPAERLFSVVGVAHLPGREGVLELLRQAGYTIRRVVPTFNIPRDSSVLATPKRNWSPKLSENGVFSYALPSDFDYTLHEGDFISHLNFDIGRGLTYLVMTGGLRPYNLDDFDANFFELDGYEIDRKEPFEHAGLQGYRYELRKPYEDLQYYRGYTFMYDQMLYYLQIGAYEESSLEQRADAEIFLDRFRVLKKNRSKWITLEAPLGGFRVRLPDQHVASRPVENEVYPYDRANDLVIHQYWAGFEQPPASLWLQYYDTPPSSLGHSEDQQFEDAEYRLETNYGVEMITSERDTLSGFPRRYYTGEFIDRGLVLEAQVIVRGARTYLLSRVDVKRGKSTKKFLPSFTLTDQYPQVPVQAVPLIDDQLQVLHPGQPAQRLTNLHYNVMQPAKYRYHGYSRDTTDGTYYQTYAYLLTPLLSVTDSTAFLEDFFSEDYERESDLLQREQVVLPCGPTAQQLTFKTEHAQLFQRVQQYRRGRYLVRKVMTSSLAKLDSPNATQFFLGDQWETPAPTFDLFAPRTTALLAGLQSPDSLVLRAALQGTSDKYTLTEQDLPKLRRVFLDNHWKKYQQTATAIELLTPVFLRTGAYGEQMLLEIFSEEDTPKDIQQAIIRHLEFNDRENALPLLFRILEENDDLTPELISSALVRFHDNPAQIVEYWPYFERLLTVGKEHLTVWTLARQVTVQDSVAATVVLAARDLFVSRGKERLAEWRTGDGRAVPAAVFGLYATFPPDPEMRDQAVVYQERIAADWATLEATAYLLTCEETIGKRQHRKLLRTDSLRTPYLRFLNTHDRLEEVPSKYYDQAVLATDLFLEKIVDAGQIADVQLVDEMEILFESQARKVYLFNFELDGETNRLGIVGFFDRDSEVRSFLDEGYVNYTTYTVTTRRRARKAEQLVEELKENNNRFDDSFELDFLLDEGE